ncbi:MAG: TPM domain-containing protein [Bacteroidetes bacterium]|nr:TPM domain-containing protein [Bacteroidota bacterium]
MGKTANSFFTKEQKEDIKQAILNAELDTSGEIRVHIENTCEGDVLDRAAYIFQKLKIHKTELRNGVLFYLALKNRKFSVIGDEGINKVVPDDFWEELRNKMLNYFRDGQFTEGLVEGMITIGKYLKKQFPYQTNDVNELSDEISFGN